MLKNQLSEKEKLFCFYYLRSRNGREAAAKSGYRFAEKAAAKLLGKKEIRHYLEQSDKNQKAADADITAGLYRLAFGCVSDAVRLLFEEELSRQEIEQLDLFNVSEIKRQKGGALEIKFFDRLKALEKLSAVSCADASDAAGNLYQAIEKSAKALSEGANE